jgi:hypothetical protein
LPDENAREPLLSSSPCSSASRARRSARPIGRRADNRQSPAVVLPAPAAKARPPALAPLACGMLGARLSALANRLEQAIAATVLEWRCLARRQEAACRPGSGRTRDERARP